MKYIAHGSLAEKGCLKEVCGVSAKHICKPKGDDLDNIVRSSVREVHVGN